MKDKECRSLQHFMNNETFEMSFLIEKGAPRIRPICHSKVTSN